MADRTNEARAGRLGGGVLLALGIKGSSWTTSVLSSSVQCMSTSLRLLPGPKAVSYYDSAFLTLLHSG